MTDRSLRPGGVDGRDKPGHDEQPSAPTVEVNRAPHAPRDAASMLFPSGSMTKAA